MRMNWKKVARWVPLCLLFTSAGMAEDYSLRYFMEKSSLKTYELSKRERTELLDRVESVLEKSKQIQLSLTRTIQGGEPDIKYQEGRFWLSKLEEDQGAIDSGARQLKVLREKPTQLVAAIRLYKALKDLSFHLTSYNNAPSFSAFIGDVAPELELWADPVFYRLYLLPLAQARSQETKVPSREKKTEGKNRKP
jgi:hypothetical protein